MTRWITAAALIAGSIPDLLSTGPARGRRGGNLRGHPLRDSRRPAHRRPRPARRGRAATRSPEAAAGSATPPPPARLRRESSRSTGGSRRSSPSHHGGICSDLPAVVRACTPERRSPRVERFASRFMPSPARAGGAGRLPVRVPGCGSARWRRSPDRRSAPAGTRSPVRRPSARRCAS